ncbi:MAG: gamma-glutamylcyclotransferase [Aquificae bacterium]|nr:gamma-glutamylcyclotransferase [Aquificota bacterium]
MAVRSYYFAYGSNLNPERMTERGVKFYSFKRAFLKNFRLTFDKVCRTFPPSFGCATIRPSFGTKVEGLLYEVDFGQATSRLDRFEAFPDHYGRTFLEVLLPSGEKVWAFTYLAAPDKLKEGLKPHPDYLAHLLKACELGLLSPEYCEFLKTFK